MPSAREIAREQELIRLRVRQQELLVSNRSWQVPAIGLGLGISSLVIGGIVFRSAWDTEYDCAYDYGYCDDDYNQTRDRTGLVMMPLGAVLTIVSVPMLVIRVVRHQKLKRVDRALEPRKVAERELMPFPILDACLHLYATEKMSTPEVAAALASIFPDQSSECLKAWANRFTELFSQSIYKWVQSPLALHVGSLDLDRERALQMPVVQRNEWGK